MSRSAPIHVLEPERAVGELEVEPEHGLSEREAQRRRQEHGPNRLRRRRRRSAWRILLDQFESVVILILAVAAVLAFATGRWAEGIAVVAVIAVNTAIGFVSEWRAVRSMEALRAMTRRQARVRRDGKERQVAAHDLVPGDVVVIGEGDGVPADVRLLEANGLQVDESALTGESVPAPKQVEPVAEEAPLAERADMLFMGTTVAQGSGLGVVSGTGMETELGKIADLAEGAGEEEKTPLERRLDRLGRRLAWVVIGVAAVVAGAGLLAGRSTVLMIETAIALGVAAIPEGLPIVTTIALARGMHLMARRQVLVNRLPAIETLGATRVIFTDKTGTLTENRMRARVIATSEGEQEVPGDEEGEPSAGETPAGEDVEAMWRRALRVGVLCTSASLGGDADEGPHGDPTEVALLRAGRAVGLTREALLEDAPKEREVPFDPELKMMATFHRAGAGGLEVAVKGATSAVLEACQEVAGRGGEAQPLEGEQRRQWTARADDLAGRGLRVLALATKQVEDAGAEPYQGLRLLGLVGLLDPPRPEVREALAACRAAGVRVVMVTGDQAETARAIAREVGLFDGQEEQGEERVLTGRDLAEEPEDPAQVNDQERRRVLATAVFARVDPGQKLRLIDLYQQEGETVAMTGDGVNDAPALRQADIGIAMGQRGTDAARQAADMVLKDDAFQSIVAAVEQGRVVFGNIRKAVLFMLCTNLAEVLSVTVASVASMPLPLRPLQILYLNVLTDVLPALALGMGRGHPGVMQRPPRPPSESVMTRRHWLAVGGWSVLLGACVLGALSAALYGLGLAQEAAVTVSFLTLAFGKLWFVFNLRDPRTRLLDNDVVRNPWLWGALGLCAGLLLLAVYLPGLSSLLETRRLGWSSWGLVLGISLVPFAVGQMLRFVQRRRESQEAS